MILAQATSKNIYRRIRNIEASREEARELFHQAVLAWDQGDKTAAPMMDAMGKLIDEYDRDLKELVG